MFDRVGEIVVPAQAATAEALFEGALEAGADDVQSEGETHTVTCNQDDFAQVREALEKQFGDPESAKLVWRPKTGTPIEGEKAETLFKMIEVLEDSDDVQQVYANFEISEDELSKLAS
jgi:transcriptional/translational regulatory protein YebC/TACO1